MRSKQFRGQIKISLAAPVGVGSRYFRHDTLKDPLFSELNVILFYFIYFFPNPAKVPVLRSNTPFMLKYAILLKDVHYKVVLVL